LLLLLLLLFCCCCILGVLCLGVQPGHRVLTACQSRGYHVITAGFVPRGQAPTEVESWLWVTDHEAPCCLQCGRRFGVMVGRNHCHLCNKAGEPSVGVACGTLRHRSQAAVTCGRLSPAVGMHPRRHVWSVCCGLMSGDVVVVERCATFGTFVTFRTFRTLGTLGNCGELVSCARHRTPSVDAELCHDPFLDCNSIPFQL
jgi:hypothetical protein